MSADDWLTTFVAARWLSYLAAFVVIGAVVFRWGVAPRLGRPTDPTLLHRAAVFGAGAAVLLVVAHVFKLQQQLRSLLDPGDPITLETIDALFRTAWGKGWIIQGVAALGSAAGLVAAALGVPAGFVLAGLGAAGLIGGAPLTGHAVALPEAGRIGPLLDAVHFGAGASWVGTLIVVLALIVGRDDRTAPTPKELIAAYSPIALVSGLLAISMGLIMGYRYLGGVAPLFTPGYGRALLLKLITLAGVAGLGFVNWRIVLPRLRRTGDSSGVRRTAAIEVGLGLLLLVATAILVALPLPGEEH
ncbi:MAG: CopD family protein [Gemmatimonadota bacterium]